MIKTKLTDTIWYPAKKLIVTQLSGDIDQADVVKWTSSLETSLDLLQDNQTFKILVDFNGFKAVDLNVHKKFRGVIPETLARYGWKTGYVHLFEEAENMNITTTRGITCIAAAHVHHDKSKIEKYDTMFGKINERFFTDSRQAQTWIEYEVI